MPRTKKPELRLPIKLTLAQRKLVAEVVPPSASTVFKLDEPNQRIIDFTEAELKKLKETAATAIQKASTEYERRPLRLVLKATDKAITQSHSLPAPDTVYQFKITLLESHPPIWRRIQVKDCTLDKLHEHIQTAMGWTNSHLHHFKIGEQLYGDPDVDGGELRGIWLQGLHDHHDQRHSAEDRQAVSVPVRVRLRRLLVSRGSLRGHRAA